MESETPNPEGCLWSGHTDQQVLELFKDALPETQAVALEVMSGLTYDQISKNQGCSKRKISMVKKILVQNRLVPNKKSTSTVIEKIASEISKVGHTNGSVKLYDQATFNDEYHKIDREKSTEFNLLKSLYCLKIGSIGDLKLAYIKKRIGDIYS